MEEGRGGDGRGRDHTAHVGELAEGVGVHLGAQPQEGADDRRRRRHPWCSPVLSGRTARLRGEEWTARSGRVLWRLVWAERAFAYRSMDFVAAVWAASARVGREEEILCGRKGSPWA